MVENDMDNEMEAVGMLWFKGARVYEGGFT